MAFTNTEEVIMHAMKDRIADLEAALHHAHVDGGETVAKLQVEQEQHRACREALAAERAARERVEAERDAVFEEWPIGPGPHCEWVQPSAMFGEREWQHMRRSGQQCDRYATKRDAVMALCCLTPPAAARSPEGEKGAD